MEKIIFDRKLNSFYKEIQHKDKQLKFLYNNKIGRFILNIIITKKIYSKLYSARYYSKKSQKDIKGFIQKHNIDMNDYPKKNYENFNDFFTRDVIEGKRTVDFSKDSVIAPADSKLMVCKANHNSTIKIKEMEYSLEDLFENKKIAKMFKGGLCLIFRLTVDDCHRYVYFDNGKKIYSKKIRGKYHSVGPVSDGKFKVYEENFRVYDLVETENFGTVLMMEVGAMTVGKINNKNTSKYIKGNEKGYFSFGASTIVLFFTEEKVDIDRDLLEKTSQNIEVKLRRGERIGKTKG